MALDSWHLVEEQFKEEFLARTESLFTIGNGYLGMRGFFCERKPAHHPAVFINGFYELSPIHYGEDAYGFARYNQTMLDLPDCRFTEVFIDGEQVCMSSDRIEGYKRDLDMRSGVLTRRFVWTGSNGQRAVVQWETLISFVHRHIGMLRLTIRTDNDARINVRSAIAMPASRPVAILDPRAGSALTDTSLICLESEILNQHPLGFGSSFKTVESGLHLNCGAMHTCLQNSQTVGMLEGTPSLPVLSFTMQGRSFDLEKCFYYYTSGRPGEQLPLQFSSKNLDEACGFCWEDLVKEQRAHLDAYWKACDVEIADNESLQQALRFNLFQLHQSAGTDGMSSLAAKGLTGSGYEGHYFWDTEIYGMPFFSHTQPQTARALLRYRISLLDRARDRARELSQKGALFPWRTINGLEASAYFPAGTAQYHINADIAYSLLQYVSITGDESILLEGGAEVIFETARLWYDLGFFNLHKGGLFCINEVTGPDEYSALVNNNCYTNAMARYHLEEACEMASHLKNIYPAYWEQLSHTLNLEEEELAGWKKAAQLMYIPYDRELGIHPQDDGFFDRPLWDEQKKGPVMHPMLLYYHPLVIYRYRLIKQADTVLALFLLHDRFPWHERKRDFDLYEPLTTKDSSLSACIQGIVALDCGYNDLGLQYCRETALMDIEDIHHNTKDGLHTAAMAGSWMAMVYGIAGYRLIDGVPSFRPSLPRSWSLLRFRLCFHDVDLQVSIQSDKTTYVVNGGSMEIRHRSQSLSIDKSACVLTKPACRAVIFDLDGVVTSTDHYHYRAWKRLADEHGWHFDEQLNQRLRGVSRRQSLMEILQYNGVTLDEERIEELTEKKNAWYREELEKLSPADILPGIKDLIADLRSKGVRTAVASASRNASFILEHLQLTGYFDVVVDPAHVICPKPDPEIFVRAADALGYYPEECAGVEDAQAGIQAIKSGMMKAVGVGDAVHPASCDLHVECTKDLNAEAILSLFLV